MSGGSPFFPGGPSPMPPTTAAATTTTATTATTATTSSSSSVIPHLEPTPPPPPMVTLPGDVNLRDRVIELISGGSAGEKIVRGFLIGVALGLIVGGLCCCWMPCFGRAERARRRRERAERTALLRGEAPLPLPPPRRTRRSLRAMVPWLRGQGGQGT